jgi:hypothetical protein
MYELKIVRLIIHVDHMVIVVIILQVNGHVSASFGGKEHYVINVSSIFKILSYD